MSKPFFRTKDGRPISSVTGAEFLSLWGTLTDHYGLQLSQLVEAASYSMAMVARFALGQSADDGKVLTFAANRVAGWVAVATMRHLVTAGADGVIVLEDATPPPAESELARQLFTMERLGIPIVTLPELLADNPSMLIDNCHTILCGLFDRAIISSDYVPNESVSRLTDILNEASTPVHSVEGPLGVNVDDGKPRGVPLYSSSTLSLAAPFAGLHAGRDLAGKHYLADASCPKELYEKYGVDMTKAFAEQPVVQITPFD